MKKLLVFVVLMFSVFGTNVAMAGEPGMEERPEAVKFGSAPISVAPPVAEVAPVSEIAVPQEVNAFETPVVEEIEVNPTIKISSEPKFEVESNSKTVVITPDVKINEYPNDTYAPSELLPLYQEPVAKPTEPENYCNCLPWYCNFAPITTQEVAVVEEEGYWGKVGHKLSSGITQTAFGWTPIFTSQTDQVEVASSNNEFIETTDTFVGNSIDGISSTVGKTSKGIWKVATCLAP